MENKRIPITVSPKLISRADFRDKALKAYLKNRRQRNLEKLNNRRGSNLLSESSDEECEPDEIFLEKAWKEYQSFFKNQIEEDFDIDHCIEQYFSDNAIQSLTVANFTDDYCFLQEEELNDLLDKMDGMDLSASSIASLECPVCSFIVLGYKDGYYTCSSCKIKARNQTFSDYCMAKASHRQNCTSRISLLKGSDGFTLICSKCGDISNLQFVEA